ncbi:MAG: ABC transporter permease [Desulfurococcales archaeon]|nr:ABC transporter permease [Desulfurococcales archaeon]
MIGPLVKKEILDLLRDPRIILGMIILPLIMFGVLGEVMSYGTQQAIYVAQPTNMRIAVIDQDHSNYSRDLISYLKSMTRETIPLENIPQDPGAFAEMNGYTGVVVISKGFGFNLTRGLPGKVQVFTYMREVSIAEASRITSLVGLVNGYGGIVKSKFASKVSVSTAFINNPLWVTGIVTMGGKLYSSSQVNALTGLLFSVVFAPLIVVGYASQIAATTMGVEKEEHTLEVLLSLPLNRKSIVVAKLSGSIVISILATLGLSAGLYIYIDSIGGLSGAGGMPLDLLKNVLTPYSLLAITIALIIGVILATSLSMLLGIFGKDVRSSQSMAGIIWTLVFVVGYGLAMIQFSTLSNSMRYVIAATPLAAPVLALKLSMTGINEFVWISILFHVIETVLVLYVLAKFISSELLITGLGLLDRLKKRRPTIISRKQNT